MKEVSVNIFVNHNIIRIRDKALNILTKTQELLNSILQDQLKLAKELVF